MDTHVLLGMSQKVFYSGSKKVFWLHTFIESALEIIEHLKDVEIWEEESMKFTCKVSKPNVKARWLRDGKAVTKEDGLVIDSKDGVHTLSVENAMVEDGGKYTIKVEDKESEARLTVKGVHHNFFSISGP